MEDKKIRKILVCIDFSEYSLMVLEYAVALANGLDSQIVVLNVINQIEIDGAEKAFSYYKSTFPNDMNVDDYVDNLKKERHEKVNQFIQEHFRDETPAINIKIDVGVPFEAILQNIESEQVDLVVMANKGHSNIARVLFGKAAEKVFRHSPVPVVSVRDRTRFKREK